MVSSWASTVERDVSVLRDVCNREAHINARLLGFGGAGMFMLALTIDKVFDGLLVPFV